MDKKIISRVQINQSAMTSSAQTRQLTIIGEAGAEFMLNVIKINGTSKESYYNFKSKSFTNSFTSENVLHGTITQNRFFQVINFPADATGDVYSIKTIAKEQTTKFTNGNFVDSKEITQVGQTTLSVQVPDTSTIDDNLVSLPSAVSSIGSTASSGIAKTSDVAWTFTNTSSDTKGFGLRLPTTATDDSFTIPDTYWYVQQATTLDGVHSSTATWTLASTTNIVPGMQIVYAASDVFVTAVSGNVITLSAPLSGSDGSSQVFRAYGPSLMKTIFDVDVEFSNFVAKGVPLEKEVRTSTTFPQSNGNVTLNLNGTYGVGGGSHVRVTGFNINETGNNNLITEVTASSTAGSVTINYTGVSDVITKALVVPVGTKLYVQNSYQVINITGSVKVKKYPSANTKVVLDTLKIITAGTADE